MRWIIRTSVMVAAIAIVLGCSSEPPVGTVVGKITYDGKPAPGGMISFMPATGGVPITIVFENDGTYRAENVPAGSVMVTVESAPDDSAAVGQKMKETGLNPTKGPAAATPKPMQYPARYAKYDSSGLKTTVKPNKDGPTTYDIAMTK